LPDSPALKAGMEVGDVILEFNGQSIYRSSDLPPLVGTTAIGSDSRVLILRDGKQQILTVVIEALPEEDVITAKQQGKDKASDKLLGMTVEPLTSELSEQTGVNEGLLVKQVDEGAAKEAGIRAGDVLVRINNKPITNVQTLESIITALPQGRPAAVLVHREGSPVFLALKTKDK